MKSNLVFYMYRFSLIRQKVIAKMLFVFSPFLRRTQKIIFGYNFGAPLSS